MHQDGYTNQEEALAAMRRIEQEDLSLGNHLSVWVITGDGKTYTVLIRFTDNPIREEFIQSNEAEWAFMEKERTEHRNALDAALLADHAHTEAQ